MSASPEVLLLDDGELDDVQKILDSISASYGRVRGSAIVEGSPAPRKLLVTTPRRIAAIPMATQASDRIVRIVVVNEDSPSLRAQLRDVGFDYLVRRPVHPEALRLLLMRCLWSGAERRGEPRVPMGFEISYRTGLRSRRAVLADISTRGCRILSKWAAEPGKQISVTLPPNAGSSAPIVLRGTVVRMALDEHLGPDGPYSAAVEFEQPSEATRAELRRVLSERARGPARLVPAAAAKPDGDAADGRPLDPPETRAEDLRRCEGVAVDVQMTPPQGARAGAAGLAAPAEQARERRSRDERRGGPRAQYDRRVPAFGDRAMRVLVARDLAMGGMRVERLSGLSVGDRLHLAIYGDADEEPFLVWGTVDRDDGARGLVIAFDPLSRAIAGQLERVVANLPAVESLHDDEAGAMGTVVTEILSD